MSQLPKLVARRKTVRARVTSLHNQRHNFVNLPISDVDSTKASLVDYKDDLKSFDDLIQTQKFPDSSDIDEDELQNETDTCEDYMIKIRECLVILDRAVNEANSNSRTRSDMDVTRSLLKQPTAPLPSFSGEDNEDLMKFLTEFDLTTSSYNYPDRDLLLLLLQQLSGKAKILIKSLEADKQSYQEAKDLLISAFASPESRKFSCIKKLTELKLEYSDEPFEFISTIKMLCESVKTLKFNTDDFLQYFVWEALNKSFQTHLINITGKTKPSIKEILDNFFVANERYSANLKSRKSKTVAGQNFSKPVKSSASYAVKVDAKSTSNASKCPLCTRLNMKDCDHPLYKCSKFDNPKLKLE